MVFKKLDFFSALAFGMLGDALIICSENMPKACPYVLIRKFSPRASQFQIIDNQYSIKIVGGRELLKALKKSKRGILEPLETAYCG